MLDLQLSEKIFLPSMSTFTENVNAVLPPPESIAKILSYQILRLKDH